MIGGGGGWYGLDGDVGLMVWLGRLGRRWK